MAERHEPDAHLLYVGYPGTMAWEFQFENCSAGRPDWPQECGCSPENVWPQGDDTCTNYTIGDNGWCL